MKKKALIVVNLAGFLHFLWNDIATLQEDIIAKRCET